MSESLTIALPEYETFPLLQAGYGGHLDPFTVSGWTTNAKRLKFHRNECVMFGTVKLETVYTHADNGAREFTYRATNGALITVKVIASEL